MARYGKKAQEKVEKSMHELKQGKLKSGSGAKVKSRKQAIAIGLSEARKEGGKVPKARKSTAKRKSGTRTKTAAKSKTASKSRGRKSTTKRTTAKKSTQR